MIGKYKNVMSSYPLLINLDDPARIVEFLKSYRKNAEANKEKWVEMWKISEKILTQIVKDYDYKKRV